MALFFWLKDAVAGRKARRWQLIIMLFGPAFRVVANVKVPDGYTGIAGSIQKQSFVWRRRKTIVAGLLSVVSTIVYSASAKQIKFLRLSV